MPKRNLREIINEKRKHLTWITRLVKHPTRRKNIFRFASKFKPIFIKGTNSTFVIDVLPIKSKSGLSISISSVGKKSKDSSRIMNVHLSAHSPDTIAVTAVQGVFGKNREIYEFENISKGSVEDYLIGVLEEHAKKVGFKKIRFIDYRSLKSFVDPFVRPQINRVILNINKQKETSSKKELAKKPSKRKKVVSEELSFEKLVNIEKEKARRRISKTYQTIKDKHFKDSIEVDFLGQQFYEKDI